MSNSSEEDGVIGFALQKPVAASVKKEAGFGFGFGSGSVASFGSFGPVAGSVSGSGPVPIIGKAAPARNMSLAPISRKPRRIAPVAEAEAEAEAEEAGPTLTMADLLTGYAEPAKAAEDKDKVKDKAESEGKEEDTESSDRKGAESDAEGKEGSESEDEDQKEVQAISAAITGRKVRGAVPLPADAPIMAREELTKSIKDRFKGPNPVKAIPATFNTGSIYATNKITPAILKKHGDPIAVDEYRPVTSSSFQDFMIQSYAQYSPYLQTVVTKGKAAAAAPKEIDRDACKKRDPNNIETFYYQNLVRDYLSRGTPYRGLLVYHGLGSGKTCTSIAAAEALYWGGQKKIFVLTPATLSNNYRKDLGKCGYYPLRHNNFWSFLKLTSPAGPEKDPSFYWLTEALGLPSAIVLAQGGGWVPDPDRPTNWETLSPEVKAVIRGQQSAHLNFRFKFIHYNGVTPKVLAQLAADGVEKGRSMFDDAVVVIDEIHNLVRTINGSQIGGNPISKIMETVEPREYTWSTPLGRERAGFRYPRGYTLYRLLQNAVGVKVVALSATPMINYAQELAILINLMGGEQRAVEISLNAAARDPATTGRIKAWARARPDIDFYSIEESSVDRSTILLVTPVPYGFVKVVRSNHVTVAKEEIKKMAGVTDKIAGGMMKAAEIEDYASRGFVRVPLSQAGHVETSRERNMDRWAVTLLKDLEASGLLKGGGVEAETAVTASRAKGPGSVPDSKFFKLRTYPMLPDDAKQFVENFVNRATLKIMNTNVLKARASGLISYYRGGSEELMPRVGLNKKELVPMSPHQFKGYVTARAAELEMESPAEKEEDDGKKKKAKGRTTAEMDLYAQATKSQATGFLSLSRAACNWVFPDEVERPKVSAKEQVKLLGAEQNKLIDADLDENMDADLDYAPAGPAGPEGEGDGEGEGEGGAGGQDAVLPDAAPEAAPAPVDPAITGIIGTLMSGLETRANDYLNVGLSNYSTKYAKIIANIRESRGPALVYSQFKTLEGLGIFSAALRAAPEKYLPLDIQKIGGEWVIPDALMTEEVKARPRYILYTGDQELEKRRLLLQLYNADISALPPRLSTQCAELLAGAEDNRDGRVCRIFMITQSGAEGISLYNTRQVHIMEPYWNNVRIQQVNGRAIRLCSHQNLPWDDRVVDIFTYLSVFSDEQKSDGSARAVMVADKSKTTDETIYEIATNKQMLANGLFEIAQAAAVDCQLHLHEHRDQGEKIQCFKFGKGGRPMFMFHPDWRKDLQAAVRAAAAGAGAGAGDADE